MESSVNVTASSTPPILPTLVHRTEDCDDLQGGEDDDDDDTRSPLRGPSPCPDGDAALRRGVAAVTLGAGGLPCRGSRHNLQVPFEQYGGLGPRRSLHSGCPLSAETLFEEGSDLIRSCGALSSVLGLRRCFSTSDITATNSSDPELLRSSASEMVLGGSAGGGAVAAARDEALGAAGARLDYASRSCSTWVAVGDMASTSQLPSPQGPPGGDASPAITAADFVRSVNKKVRQTYIKRRLLTTYKALERIAQSELNLQAKGELAALGRISKSQVSREILRLLRRDMQDSPHAPCSGLLLDAHAPQGLLGAARSLSARDVERDKGKPLTKYERNIMIFNWLHSLDESSLDRMT